MSRASEYTGSGNLRIYPTGVQYQTSFCNDLRGRREGVMLHYDGSSSDAGSISWLQDSRANVSYQYIVLRDGTWAAFAPLEKRAWHAGHCSPSDERFTYTDGNSAFYGVAIAANKDETATLGQLLTVSFLVRTLFAVEKWYPVEEAWRLVGHSSEAVFPEGHPNAGERGRKIDPEGYDPRRPVMSVNDIRSILPLIKVG